MDQCCRGGGGDGAPRRQASPFDPPDAETLRQIDELEAQIKEVEDERQACLDQAKELEKAELAGQGSHAAEIHRLKQRRMMLATQAQHLKVRVRFLRATW